MKKITGLILLVASASTLAQGLRVDLQVDEDGKVSPETSLPYFWSENLYSELRFRSTSVTNDDTSRILERSTTTLDEEYKRIDVIGFRSQQQETTWGFSAGVELIDIERREFGFGSVSNNALTIDNSVDISATRLLIAGSYQLDSDFIRLNASANLAPAGSLEVNQDTHIGYTSTLSTSESNSNNMSLSYGAELDLLLRTGTGFDVGLNLQYDFLPLEYELGIVNNTLSAFETATIEQDHTSTRIGAKLFLPEYQDMGRPVIGFTQEKIDVEQDGDRTSETLNYLVFGLDKPF